MKRNADGYSWWQPLLVIVLVVVAAAAASWGTYSWQHHKVNDLNSQISSLNTQVSKLNGQVMVLTGQLNKACPAGSVSSPCAGYTYSSAKGVSVIIFTPAKDVTVSSPLAVTGEVPGNWSFEAQFPVQLKDSSGHVVAQATANVLGSWQTSQPVPFSAQLTYTSSPSGSGTLVLQKDNPSGLPQNADSVSIPVKF